MKLSINDEINNGVNVVIGSILPAITALTQKIDRLPISEMIRFSTWIGGDRDGNPFVTDETLGTTTGEHASAILRYYMQEIKALESKLCIDDTLLDLPDQVIALASQAVSAPAHYSTESFRAALFGIHQRLGQVLENVEQIQLSAHAGYTARRFRSDLRVLSDALSALGLDALHFSAPRGCWRGPIFTRRHGGPPNEQHQHRDDSYQPWSRAANHRVKPHQ